MIDDPLRQRAAEKFGARATALLVASFALLFLLTFAPTEFSDNAIHYLNAVQRTRGGQPDFYPPHLLHSLLVTLVWVVLDRFAGCDLFCAGIVHSAIWATIGVVALFVLLWRLSGSLLVALGGAVALLVAHGPWVYATQAEVYAPTVGTSMAATALLLTARGPTIGTARLIAAAIFWAWACFYHLGAVTLLLPYGIWILGRHGVATGWRPLLLLYLTAGGIVLSGFLVAFVWAGTEPLTPRGFLDWVLEIKSRPLTDWGTTANLVSFGSMVRAVWSQLKAITLLPDWATVPLAPPLDQLPLAIVGGLALAATLSWTLVKILRAAEGWLERLVLLAQFAVFFLFFSWWDTSVHKFYIPSVPPLILLAALALRDLWEARVTPRERNVLAGASVAVLALLFLFNAVSVIELRRSRGPAYAETAVIDRLAPAECRLYVDGTQMGPLILFHGRDNVLFSMVLPQDFYLREIGRAPGPRRPFDGEPCAFVALGWLSEPYFVQLVRRFMPPERWPDYIAYLLDARPAGEGGRLSVNPIRFVETEALTYAVIDRRERVEIDGIEEVVGRIRALTAERLAREVPPALVDRYGWSFLAIPRTDVPVDRDRILIFGYGWGDIVRRPIARTDMRDFVGR